MPPDSRVLDSSKRDWLQIAGVTMVIVSALAQAFMIGITWGVHAHDLCDQATWRERLACLHPQSYQVAGGALQGWCVAATTLLLARYLTPYISVVVPGSMIAMVTWLIHGVLQKEGVVFGPVGRLTPEDLNTFAQLIGTIAILFAGPVVGAWLVGYGVRRRRRNLRPQHSGADSFN